MKKLIIFLTTVVFFCSLFIPNIMMAAPFSFGDGGHTLQGVFNNITTSPVAGNSSINVLTDSISDNLDSYWSITGTGGSVSTMIIEIAGYAPYNSFGIYDIANPFNKMQLFAGTDSAGDQVTLSITHLGDVYLNHMDTGIDFSGNNFGFYLDVSLTQNIWYSDTSLNADAVDHMIAYQGKNIDEIQILPWAAGMWTSSEYALAFEDLFGGGDRDYADMVVMVESIMPSPEPGTLLLLGFGLMGVGLTVRKKGNCFSV